MAQFVTRVPDELVRDVDRLIADGLVSNRSDAVRLGLQRLVDQHRRQRVGADIVEGYLRRPQAESEVGWTDAATAEMIAEEPW